MEININNSVNIPWVWSVAQRLEHRPRQLKMWGSIPYHAHNFLIRFAIGVRTTIEHMIIEKKQLKYLLKIIGGYNESLHSVLALILLRAQATKTRYQSKITYILVRFLWDPYVVRQGDDQHQNLAIYPGLKFTNVLNTGA